ncbi:hypothetical protein HN587_06075 [Candidatus Woesearchaeota archaeon]|jgi:hypothetical protein|nr:hypothetical protein [Candidatus Woesearchaeota archaeon]
MKFNLSKAQKKYLYLLIGLFVISLSIRLYFAFQSPHFTGESAYFNLRQIEHIRETGIPLFEDSLSYSGRFFMFAPLFHYILSFFSLFFGTFLTAKILPNIFAATFVFIAYLIAYEIMGNRRDSLITAFICSFIPIYIAETVNSVSVYSLSVPLFFLLIYFFLKVSQSKKYIYYFVLLCFIVPLVSPIIFFLIIGLLLYLVFMRLEYKNTNWLELELILFATFFVIWFEFIFFKNAFLFHGYAVIWQNFPHQILFSYFKDTSILEAFTTVGILPFVLGVFSMYKCMLKDKDKKVYLLRSFVFAITILLWLKLVRLELGLILLSLFLSILAGPAYRFLISYFEQTKFAFFKKVFIATLLIIFILTSVLACFAFSSKKMDNALSEEEFEAFEWIKQNTPKDSVILSTLGEGQFIASISNRKNVGDMNFLLIKDSSVYFDDIKGMYSFLFKSEALELLQKYSVDYIYFSDHTKFDYDIKKIKYVDKECFPLVYESESIPAEVELATTNNSIIDIKIYEVKCKFG